MIHALKAEITKLTSIRSTWVYLVLLVGSIAGPITLMSVIPQDGGVELGWSELAIGQSIFMIIALIFAASSVAGDIGHHMVAHSFLTQRNRSQWIVAKLLVIVGVLEVALFVGLAASFVVAQVVPQVNWNGGDGFSILVAALSLPAYALMAAGVAAITRSKLAGSGLLIALFLVVEPLVQMGASRAPWVETVYKLLPGGRASDLVTWHNLKGMGVNMADHPMITGPELAVSVIAVWTVALVVAGLVSNQTRDVK